MGLCVTRPHNDDILIKPRSISFVLAYQLTKIVLNIH